MRGIVGLWYLDGRPAERDARRMLKVVTRRAADPDTVWHDGSIALSNRHFLPRSGETVAMPTVRDERYVLVADARIDNRDEVTRALGLRGGVDDTRLILEAYARWGAACVDRLIGVFAFAVWDLREQVLFCARDPVGVRPFYYTFRPHRLFACASTLEALLTLADVPREINEVRVADYLAGRGDDATTTFYEGLLRLPPGHTLTLSRHGEPVVRRYWEFGGREAPRVASDAEFEEGFRAVFEEAVRCRLPRGPVGVMLSGGLDSSSVTGVAAQLHSAPLHTFSATFPDLPEEDLARADERQYVAAVVEATGAVSHLVPLTDHSPADELDRYLDHLGQPPFISNLYLIHQLQVAARSEGIHVLLDGCEGDDAVSHGYERFWELGYHGQWDVFQREADALVARVGGRTDRVFSRFGRRGAMLRARRHPIRSLTEMSSLSEISGESVATLIKQCWLKPLLRSLPWWKHGRTTSAPDLLSSDLVQRVDYSARLEAYAEQRRPAVFSAQESHRLVLAAGAGGIASVMEETSHLAAMDGVERRHPFYDVRLLNYCLALPVDQKLSDGWTRSILRRSLRDVLPREVRDRTDKADLSPHFFRSFRCTSQSRLDQVLDQDWSHLQPFVDRHALVKTYQRGDSPSPWYALLLANWLKRISGAPKASAA